MYPTTKSAPRSGARRLAFLGLLAAMLLLALTQAVPALAASSPFDGGPLAVDTSTVVANDHTVYAMRFSATTGGTYPLDADTTYYVKLRFTPNADGSPAGVDNRGFTWNGASGAWAQERDDWTAFPTVTTDATGAIAQSDWLYCKFGDTTKSGTYYLLVSLSSGVAGTTRNGNVVIPVTVYDTTSAGAWVHDGVDNSTTYTFKRADILDHAAPANPVALQFTEKNLVDDDGNGVVDDEQYGIVQNGGFRMAVPVGQALDIRMQKKIWSVVPTGFTVTTPDTDLALGAADQAAPSAPGALTIDPMDGGADVSWGAASDDTGVSAYHVYRWVDAPAGAGYTPLPEKVATVTSGTSYTDSGLTNGTTYHYQVRAVDAATNVGPRSAIGDVTPTAVPQLTLQATAATVKWGGEAMLTGELTDGADPFAVGQQVSLEWSHDGTTWTLLQMLDPDASFAYVVAVAPTQKTMYRLVFDGDVTHAKATSDSVTVTPRAKLGRPVAPRTVKKHKKFSAYGTLAPKHSAGKSYVKIKCYQKKSGKWRLRTTVKATTRNYKSYSRYSAKFSLKARGSWKLVASYRATTKYASTTSSVRYVRVK
jgi:hypothetical protein